MVSVIKKLFDFDLEKSFAQFIKILTPVDKTAFISAISIGYITHVYYFVQRYINEDDIRNLVENFNRPVAGRWLTNLLGATRMNFTPPFVMGTISIILLAVSSVELCRVLNIRRKVNAFLIAFLLVTFPTSSNLFTYFGTVDASFASMFFAITAVYFTYRYKKYGGLVGAISLTLSLSMYQGFIGMTVGLCLMSLVLDVFDTNNTIKNIIFNNLRYLFMGASGLILYMISVKVSLKISGVSLVSYKGMDTMGQVKLEQLPALIKRAYSEYIPALSGKMFTVSDFLLILHLTAVLLGIIYLFIAIKNKGVFKDAFRLCLIIISTLLIPLALNILVIVAPDSKTYINTIYPLVLIFLFIIALSELDVINKPVLIKSIMIITFTAMSLNYLILDSLVYLKGEMYYKRTYSLTNRIIAKIDPLLPHSESRKVALIGVLPNEYYYNANDYFERVNHPSEAYYYQYIGYKMHPGWMNTVKFARNVQNIHGLTVNVASNDDFLELKDKVINMPIWPEAGSVAIINDIIVVHLNEQPYIKTEEISKNTFRFTYAVGSKNPLSEYAWYIYKDSEKFDTIWYTAEDNLVYTFTENGSYYIQGFMRLNPSEAPKIIRSEIINFSND